MSEQEKDELRWELYLLQQANPIPAKQIAEDLGIHLNSVYPLYNPEIDRAISSELLTKAAAYLRQNKYEEAPH